MPKVLLKAGAEVDFLSEDELETKLTKAAHLYRDLTRGEAGETIVRSAPSFETDASGNTTAGPYGGGYGAYRVPVGYDAYLTRAMFDFEGSDAASPTTCDIRICADQNTPSALRALYNAVPSVYEASKSHAPMFRGGQLVVIAITGGPVSTNIYVTVQVILVERRAIQTDALTDH